MIIMVYGHIVRCPFLFMIDMLVKSYKKFSLVKIFIRVHSYISNYSLY